jgi:hypothetical protein
MRARNRTVLGVAVAVSGAVVYARVGRPWQLRWGATEEEVARGLPGDDLVTRPTFNATRAITIDAAPESIWPWLVQMGTTRAGWYSYDLLDNLGRHSATTIVPELQHLAPGDVVPMSPDGTKGIKVHSVEPPHTMIWGTPGDTTWTWRLDPLPDGSTRLITRIRSRVRLTPTSLVFSALTEVADIWMMRKTLHNLRTRAEAHGSQPIEIASAR